MCDMCAGTCRDQKRVLDLLKLEVQVWLGMGAWNWAWAPCKSRLCS